MWYWHVELFSTIELFHVELDRQLTPVAILGSKNVHDYNPKECLLHHQVQLKCCENKLSESRTCTFSVLNAMYITSPPIGMVQFSCYKTPNGWYVVCGCFSRVTWFIFHVLHQVLPIKSTIKYEQKSDLLWFSSGCQKCMWILLFWNEYIGSWNWVQCSVWSTLQNFEDVVPCLLNMYHYDVCSVIFT